MIFALSLRSLLRRRTRTLLALAGIAVSAALLLDMTMLAAGLSESFESLFGLRGYALRVTPRGTLPFDSEAGIADAEQVRERIAAVPGVRSVAPVLGARLYRVAGDSLGAAVFANGVDPRAQMLYTLLAGQDPAAGEVVVSQPLAREAALGIGDTLRLAGELDLSLGRPREVTGLRVSGVGDFLYDSAGQQSVALPLAGLQAMARRPDEVSLFAVAATEGADEDSVAARIERALPAVSAYSMRTLVAETNRRLLYFRQLATILGSVALVVTALLISTIVAIGVRERFGEIATLRAIGVARRRLLGGVVVEGLTLAALGCLVGLPLGVWVAGRLDAILRDFPGLPARLSFFVWNAGRAGVALALVIAVGALAGLLPAWAAVRAPLAAVLREEGE